MNKTYAKYVEIIQEYMNAHCHREDIAKSLKDELVNRSLIDRVITKLHKFNILEDIKDRGHNKVKESLIDTNYFSDRVFNSKFLASLVYVADEETEDILKYVFVKTTKKIIGQTNLRYSKRFNSIVLNLIEKTKYLNFLYIIEKNISENVKTILNVEINRKYFELYPVELFIYGDKWYICFYNDKSENYEIYNQKDIQSISLLSDNSIQYFNHYKIDSIIKDFIEDKSKLDMTIRISPQLLNTIIKLDLIDGKYRIWKETEKFNSGFNSSHKNSNAFISSLVGRVDDTSKSKVEYEYKEITFDTNDEHDDLLFSFEKGVTYKFDVDIPETYAVEISTTKSKMKTIIRLFSDNFTIIRRNFKKSMFDCH